MSERDTCTLRNDVLTARDNEGARASLAVLFATGYLVLAAPAMIRHSFDASSVLFSLLLAASLVAISAVDAISFRLPDEMTIPLIALGLATAWWMGLDRLEYRIAAALIGYVTLWLVATLYLQFRHRPGLGLGDAKLFAAAGAWLGYESLPGVLLWASLAALLSVLLTQGRSASSQMRLPFGPFLAFSIWVIWLYGPPFSGI